jgi:ergothioneine biosynthesis protein EgtB
MSTLAPAPAESLAYRTALLQRFRSVRRRTMALAQPLTPEDMMVQSCPEASPAKWHLAHTSWFFESFILREYAPGYRVFNPDFVWLFNSYYQSFSAFPEKRLRSSFSRPALEEIVRYRTQVDEAIEHLLERDIPPEALNRIELGVNHEEQHQELLLTDILHAFFTNPLRPAYADHPNPGYPRPGSSDMGRPKFLSFEGGLKETGHAGEGFCFDNELPRHKVWLEPYALADRLVTCGEYAEFIADGGYRRAEFWLSDGWNAVNNHGWRAPLYWTGESGEWTIFTLRGEQALTHLKDTPVSHVSYYEADAYARWASRRLATEFEWEAAAEGHLVEGNLLDSGRLIPTPADLSGKQASAPDASDPLLKSALPAFECPSQLFGDCWEWTASAYLGYPGFHPLPGSLGEYNGKFMSGQFVLRGGSCVTPAPHIRASYRNFFSPETRWQFSGIRLAS